MPTPDLPVIAAQLKDLDRRVTLVEANQRTEQLARIDERTQNTEKNVESLRTELRQGFQEFSARVDTIKNRSTTAIITVLCSTVVGVLALVIGRAVS